MAHPVESSARRPAAAVETPAAEVALSWRRQGFGSRLHSLARLRIGGFRGARCIGGVRVARQLWTWRARKRHVGADRLDRLWRHDRGYQGGSKARPGTGDQERRRPDEDTQSGAAARWSGGTRTRRCRRHRYRGGRRTWPSHRGMRIGCATLGARNGNRHPDHKSQCDQRGAAEQHRHNRAVDGLAVRVHLRVSVVEPQEPNEDLQHGQPEVDPHRRPDN